MTFYAYCDEDALFYWLKNIKAIKEIKGIGRELHLLIYQNQISKIDKRELKGVFKRYNFNNIEQLEIL